MTRMPRQLDLTFDHMTASTPDTFAALFAVPFECDTTARRMTKARRKRQGLGQTAAATRARVTHRTRAHDAVNAPDWL